MPIIFFINLLMVFIGFFKNIIENLYFLLFGK